MFRRHTCGYGRLPAGHWHGLLLTEQENMRGSNAGWEARFRVLLTAAIPTTHTNPYFRGVQDIDVVFPFPVVFRALLGEGIRMRGRLRWDGRRPSRGQPMGFTWMPMEGDGTGLTGPVQFAGWWFGSDFIYGERPDVEVWLISLQIAGFSLIDTASRVEGSQRTYEPPAFVAEARRERNASRRRRREQKRPQPVSADESDTPPGVLRSDEVEAMRLLPGANVLSLTRPPVSASMLTSLPPQGADVPTDTAIVSARPTDRGNVMSGLTTDDPFSHSGGDGRSSEASSSSTPTELQVSRETVTKSCGRYVFHL